MNWEEFFIALGSIAVTYLVLFWLIDFVEWLDGFYDDLGLYFILAVVALVIATIVGLQDP